jgi:hypothetical protein
MGLLIVIGSELSKKRGTQPYGAEWVLFKKNIKDLFNLVK